MTEDQTIETRFSVHEAVCSQRWEETIQRIKRLEAILIACAGGVILSLWHLGEKVLK
jgi:hypothetical protein